jgi:hypothetical protein
MVSEVPDVPRGSGSNRPQVDRKAVVVDRTKEARSSPGLDH